MRAIRNLEDLYGYEFGNEINDDEFEESGLNYESDDSGNDSDPKNYFNNLYRPRSRSFVYGFDPEDFISDPDSEAEPNEGIQEDLIEDDLD